MLISSCSYAGGRTATAKKRILAIRFAARHAQGDVWAARDMATVFTMGRRFGPLWIRGGRARDPSDWAGPWAAHRAFSECLPPKRCASSRAERAQDERYGPSYRASFSPIERRSSDHHTHVAPLRMSEQGARQARRPRPGD